MSRRVTPIVVGLVTVAMLTFGQLCAFSTLLAPVHPETEGVTADHAADSNDHEATCDPSQCGGEREDGEHGCPSGASMCCSTWGPPTARLAVVPPSSVYLSMADAWLVVPQSHALDVRAAEVALFELARPPGNPTDALLASTLSRRGPPALI